MFFYYYHFLQIVIYIFILGIYYIVSKNKHDIFTEVLEKYPDIEKNFETMNYDVYISKRNHSTLQ